MAGKTFKKEPFHNGVRLLRALRREGAFSHPVPPRKLKIFRNPGRIYEVVDFINSNAEEFWETEPFFRGFRIALKRQKSGKKGSQEGGFYFTDKANNPHIYYLKKKRGTPRKRKKKKAPKSLIVVKGGRKVKITLKIKKGGKK